MHPTASNSTSDVQAVINRLAEINGEVENFLAKHAPESQGTLEECARAIQEICSRMDFSQCCAELPIEKPITEKMMRNMRDLSVWVVENGLDSSAVGGALKASIRALGSFLGKDFDQKAVFEGFNIDRLLADGINTPLTRAIRKSEVNRVSWLLETRGNILMGDRTGLSPLQIAAMVGNVPIIELLLYYTAFPDASNLRTIIPKDNTGKIATLPLHVERLKTPLGLAFKYKKLEAAKALLEVGSTVIEHGHETRLAYQSANPTRAAANTSDENSISRECFAAKLLSHSLQLTGDLIFLGGKLRLEGSKSPWLCWEMLESFHGFIQEYPNRLQANEIELVIAQLSQGGMDREAERNYSRMVAQIQRSNIDGPLVQFHTGYEGHTAEWVFLNQHLMISNKGAESRRVGEVYRIDSNLLDARRIKNMIVDLKKDDKGTYRTMLKTLPIFFGAISDEFTQFIESTYPFQELGVAHEGGFCSWVSVETAVFFTLALARFTKTYATPEVIKELQDTFIAWVRFTQLYAMEKYFNQIDHGEFPFNKQLATQAFEQIRNIRWPSEMEPRVKELEARMEKHCSSFVSLHTMLLNKILQDSAQSSIAINL